MNVTDLDLPPDVIDFYKKTGISELYPPQAEAIKKGLLEGRNMLAAVPTASGKTLLAEFAMLKSILPKPGGGKALYIVPLRALASEKYEHFSKFRSIDVDVAISTGDFDRKDEFLGRNDIIVVTSEKADSLMRNRTAWMGQITVVVADEIHLIDSPDRGPTLEITLVKLMKTNPHVQIVGLSATVGNAEEVAGWLNAELVVSNWRPTDLREGVFFGDSIIFKEGTRRKIQRRHKDETINLVLDTIEEGGQCLIFESSRRNAESVAERIGDVLQIKDVRLDEIASLIREDDTSASNKLAECAQEGSAYHHAGLTSEQRRLIEDGFRKGYIKVVSATPTLAAGLNLPARRVIIKGYMRYDPNNGMEPIPVLEYKQMAGRAGRPGLDPYGESVLIAGSEVNVEKLMKRYVLADAEEIWSKVGAENALRTHILSSIATGFAYTRDAIVEFMGSTFYAHQQKGKGGHERIEEIVENVIGFLKEHEMVTGSGRMHPTNVGKMVSLLYIDPLSGAIIMDALNEMKRGRVKVTDLTLLHLICKTQDIRQLYLREKEYEPIGDFAEDHSSEFVSNDSSQEWFLGEVKTAMVLLEWINEVHEDFIIKKFGIGQGDIRTLADTARWLMHSVAELSRLTDGTYTKMAKDLVDRIYYGAAPELLELIQIRDIGRVRARKLYNAGYRDIESLKNADINELSKLIGGKIAIKVMKHLGVDVAESKAQPADEQRQIGDF